MFKNLSDLRIRGGGGGGGGGQEQDVTIIWNIDTNVVLLFRGDSFSHFHRHQLKVNLFLTLVELALPYWQ